MSEKQVLEKAVELADSAVRQFAPEMKWMWGEALLGYALTELDSYLKEDRYFDFTRAYCDYYVLNEPRVDQSDTCAPALVTYAMYKRTGNEGYKYLTDKVLKYIRGEPRVLDQLVNHLGSSPEGRFYPRSIWVDSLMMFTLFPARYAVENAAAELLDYAARQPALYAAYLQDREKKLWYHSYWIKAGRCYPGDLFWGRGNGWVVAALPLILDYLPPGHPEREQIIRILESTSGALLKYQRRDGYFETILNRPGRTYRESSATVLVAAGWLHGVRCGYLNEQYREPAVRALNSVVENLEYKNGEVYLTEISGPTIPLPLFPYLGYRLVPRGRNYKYGIAALILAALEYDKLLNRK